MQLTFSIWWRFSNLQNNSRRWLWILSIALKKELNVLDFILRLNYKESWGLKNWWFWTVVLEKTLESPLDCKDIQPAHPKGNQSWIFTGRTDAEAETPILWPPDAKNWLIWKDTDTEKDWRWEEKGTTKDEMVGWHHRLDGHEFELTLRVGDGQGGMACCSPWGCKESDMTEDWTKTILILSSLIIFFCFCILSLLWLSFLFGTKGSLRRQSFFTNKRWGSRRVGGV